MEIVVAFYLGDYLNVYYIKCVYMKLFAYRVSSHTS